MQAWWIDALDPRAGLAFASWRDFTLDSETTCLHEAPCCFIGAPHFRPEPVSSGSLAWCANRGAFQVGLFIGENEVPFATLAKVADFVRRVYLRSGGGDNLNGGGAPTPPRPSEGGPDLSPVGPLAPNMPGGGLIFVRGRPPNGSPSGSAQPSMIDVLRRVSWFASLAQDMEPGPVHGYIFDHWVLSFPGDDDRHAMAAPSGGVLEHAVLLLIREMLLQFPSSGDPEPWQDWTQAARALGWVIGQLGLWSSLRDPANLETLYQWTGFLRTSQDHPFREP